MMAKFKEYEQDWNKTTTHTQKKMVYDSSHGRSFNHQVVLNQGPSERWSCDVSQLSKQDNSLSSSDMWPTRVVNVVEI